MGHARYLAAPLHLLVYYDDHTMSEISKGATCREAGGDVLLPPRCAATKSAGDGRAMCSRWHGAAHQGVKSLLIFKWLSFFVHCAASTYPACPPDITD
jgi:hypothetical protein